MAPLAIRKIIAAECPFVVVTGRTTLSAGGRKMLRGNGRGDLSLLRRTGPYVVAIIAA